MSSTGREPAAVGIEISGNGVCPAAYGGTQREGSQEPPHRDTSNREGWRSHSTRALGTCLTATARAGTGGTGSSPHPQKLGELGLGKQPTLTPLPQMCQAQLWHKQPHFSPGATMSVGANTWIQGQSQHPVAHQMLVLGPTMPPVRTGPCSWMTSLGDPGLHAHRDAPCLQPGRTQGVLPSYQSCLQLNLPCGTFGHEGDQKWGTTRGTDTEIPELWGFGMKCPFPALSHSFSCCSTTTGYTEGFNYNKYYIEVIFFFFFVIKNSNNKVKGMQLS